MTNKVMLPFELKAYNLIYHNVAFPMGIIQANAEMDLSPWLCGRCINCFFKPGSRSMKLNICLRDSWGYEVKLLSNQGLSLNSNLYECFDIDFIEAIKAGITNRYYVTGFYNEEYIQAKPAYQTNYYYHDYLIVGYDDTANSFRSVAYLPNGRFDFFDITYDEMRLATDTLKTPTKNLAFIKFNPRAELQYRYDEIIFDLQDYMASRNSIESTPSGKIYGISALYALGEHFCNTMSQDQYIDIRYTRGFMEHKFFMHFRVNKLFEIGKIQSKECVDAANENYNKAEKVHLLALKFIMTKNEAIAVRICNEIKEVLDSEKLYLPILLQELQENTYEK